MRERRTGFNKTIVGVASKEPVGEERYDGENRGHVQDSQSAQPRGSSDWLWGVEGMDVHLPLLRWVGVVSMAVSPRGVRWQGWTYRQCLRTDTREIRTVCDGVGELVG